MFQSPSEKKYRVIIFCIFLFFLCMGQVSASPVNSPLELQRVLLQADNLRLEKSPTWLRLLHFDRHQSVQRSEILSPEFFISHTRNPKVELEATLRAMFQVINGDANQHAQCRFPARFYWLQQQLNFNEKNLPIARCERLQQWAKFSSLNSISLVLVGGYFGNPASTFGHLLVKLNNSEYKNSSGNLLDQSINYGAQVPDSETIPVYIIKGLFGGYVSRFRDKAFYKQDRVYSRQELRDMWEYELDLTSEQQRFLVYHLWEVMGMKSTYYFLKKNCAYRVAELLELVTEKSLTSRIQPWYLPISLFQKLTDIEQSRYIKKITFLPSSERKLYHQFDQLQQQDALLVNKLLASSKSLTKDLLGARNTMRQAQIIDVMLAYYQYKLIDAEQDKPQWTVLKQRKNQLLLMRLQLPVANSERAVSSISAMTSPAEGSKPRLFSVGFGQDKGGHFLRLGMTAIHYDLLTDRYGVLANSALKFFDLSFKSTEKKKLSLDYFNLASVQKLNISPTKLYQESEMSWRIAVGIKARNKYCADCNGLFLSVGVGKAWQTSQKMLSYVMLDTHYHAKADDFLLTPNIGFIVKPHPALKSVLEIGWETNLNNGKKDKTISWQTRYALDKNNALRLAYEKQSDALSLSYYYHW